MCDVGYRIIRICVTLFLCHVACGAEGLLLYEDPDGLLQKVIVDKTTLHVFVGGRNALYKFDKDLNLLGQISTGPVLDSIDCDPAHMEICSSTNLQDNDAKILLDNPQVPDTLLFCGSVKQGLCASVNKTEFNSIQYLDPSNLYNFIGGKLTSTAFFGKPVSYTQASSTVVPLYVGQQYDGRPFNLSPEMFSTRYVRPAGKTMDISLMMNHPSQHVKTAKDVHADWKASYFIRYITSFEYGKFTFFVTVQREGLTRGWYNTHLVRVCQEDSGYYSFAELELFCEKLTSVNSVYKVAEDAYFGPIGKDFAQRYRINDKDPVLYISFGTDDRENSIANATRGSAVCVFPMADIMSEFQRAFADCYQGRNNLLYWIYPERTRCTPDQDASIEIRDNINFCTAPASVYNDAVGRDGFGTQMTSNITLEKEYGTSLLVTIQNNFTVALQGTNKGTIFKNLIDGTHFPPYAEIDIAEGLSNKTVAKDMALDPDEKYLYAMAGGRIVKLDTRTCSIYTDCASCVMASQRDPLGCGWCGSYCSQEDHCASSQWSSTSCPPIFHQFEPRSGPVQGGTKITIEGAHFGNYALAQTKLVKVAYEECDLDGDLFTPTRIVCTTRRSSTEKDSQVSVEIVDNSRTTEKFKIRGRADSIPNHFFYKNPEVHSIVPQRGPQSGGTPLTISGKDLYIGSELEVTVVDLACEILGERSSEDQIICKTSPLPESFYVTKRSVAHTESTENDSLAEGGVRVQIDEALLEINELTFSYYEDPYILDVKPRRGIASGGIRLTVEGYNLDVVHEPKLVLYDPLLNIHYNHSDCTASGDGSQLLCESPKCFTNATHAPKGNAPLELQINFAMDGVSELIDFANRHPDISDFVYYVDPVIHPIGDDGVLSFYTNEIYLEIKGKYLNLGASVEDYTVEVGKDICMVVDVTSNVLRCDPIIPKTLSENEPLRNVKVKVGRRTYDIGSIQYTQRNIQLIMAYLLGPFLVITIIFVLCIVVGVMKKYKKGPFRKKPILPRVVYRSQDGGEDTAGNPYMRTSQMWPDHRREEAEPFIDNEYRQFLIDSNLLIDRDKLKLLDVVGQGNFGCVYKGLLQYGEGKEEMEVAVKTLKTLAESRYANVANGREARLFLEEALRMREFDHANILRLIGISLDNSEGHGQPMVVLPFMKHGDLLTFIRDENNSPTVKELMEFGIDIAQGMTYLANLKFVHRDLAARNCMLDDRMHVQVADFGLSRDVYETDYYSSDGRRAKLPVKWMAVESLEKGIYNTKTDVWSFGVVLWELMTRGVIPYAAVGNFEIVDYLKEGRRMPQPSYCPDALYEVMVQCWHPDGNKRPPFHRLVTTIRTIITDMQADDPSASVEAQHIYSNVPTSQTYLYPQAQPVYSNSRDATSSQNESTSRDDVTVSRDYSNEPRDSLSLVTNNAAEPLLPQTSTTSDVVGASRDGSHTSRADSRRHEYDGQVAGSRSIML